MSGDRPDGSYISRGNTGGYNRQQGIRGISVQGSTRDVHYYAAACAHRSATSARLRTAGFSPAPYERLREELHRIIRACSHIVDDLRDDTDDSEGSPWE
jgi:GMP synthase PP-ATPase subunit